jgi:hypothetical protein
LEQRRKPKIPRRICRENKVAAQTVAANAQNSLVFQIDLPEGYHLNTAAPNRFEISTGDAKNIKIAGETKI